MRCTKWAGTIHIYDDSGRERERWTIAREGWVAQCRICGYTTTIMNTRDKALYALSLHTSQKHNIDYRTEEFNKVAQAQQIMIVVVEKLITKRDLIRKARELEYNPPEQLIKQAVEHGPQT